VTIYLKKPYNGLVQATVKAGLIGADGIESTTSYSVVT